MNIKKIADTLGHWFVRKFCSMRSKWTSSYNDIHCWCEEYLTDGRRVLTVRDGKTQTLTGMWSFRIYRRYDSNIILHAGWFLTNLDPEDEIYFGKKAQSKYKELNPPRPPHQPMFDDGTIQFG